MYIQSQASTNKTKKNLQIQSQQTKRLKEVGVDTPKVRQMEKHYLLSTQIYTSFEKPLKQQRDQAMVTTSPTNYSMVQQSASAEQLN